MKYLLLLVSLAFMLALYADLPKAVDWRMGELTPLESTVNVYRTTKDLPSLIHSDTLTDVATARCATIEASGNYSHDGWMEPFKGIGFTPNNAAENLARFDDHFNSPEDVVRAWVRSPDHNATLKGEYSYVGTAQCGPYTVQLYAN
jgi:uncharacterized protein YkwD